MQDKKPDRPLEFWGSVLRSDEAKLWDPWDRRSVWREKAEARDKKNTIPTVKR